MKKYGEMYVGDWIGKEGRESCYYVVIFKKKLKTAQDVSCLIWYSLTRQNIAVVGYVVKKIILSIITEKQWDIDSEMNMSFKLKVSI